MVREDIVGALTNALERGESEEEAKQSFLNASYPEDEIDEAVSYLKTHQKDEEIIIEPKLNEGEIEEVKDIKALKKQEIKRTSIQQPQKAGFIQRISENKILKYSLIGGGVFILTVIITLLVLYFLK